mgnify:CR=1 FL=1
MKKKLDYTDAGFNKDLTRENEEQVRKRIKDGEELALIELKQYKVKKEIELLEKGIRPKVSLKISSSKNIYDSRESSLILAGETIVLPRDRNEDYLCRVVFLNNRNMKREWSWEELIKASKNRIVSRSEHPEKEPWRPVYNACGKLNDRIERVIGIKNFFLMSPITTIKINPKYLVYYFTEI